jgi:hypothetical protein
MYWQTADKTHRGRIRTDSWYGYRQITTWEIGPISLCRDHTPAYMTDWKVVEHDTTKWTFKIEFKWGDWIIK